MEAALTVRVEISSFAHATEDVEKVRRAISRICPPGVPLRILGRQVRGHYGNQITICSLRLSDRPSAELFFNRLRSSISAEDKNKLYDQIRSHLDESGRLHLRLDKQAALNGEFVLRDDDPVKIKILFRNIGTQGDDVVEHLRQLFESGD